MGLFIWRNRKEIAVFANKVKKSFQILCKGGRYERRSTSCGGPDWKFGGKCNGTVDINMGLFCSYPIKNLIHFGYGYTQIAAIIKSRNSKAFSCKVDLVKFDC